MAVRDAIGRLLGRLGAMAHIAGRTLLALDTNSVPADWRHVTKVDPEDAKTIPLLYALYLQHTSAVSVGGSRDVTSRNTEETFRLLEWAPVPAFHEPSGARHVTQYTLERAAFLAIPEVLNGSSEALVGTLGEGVEYIREEMVPALLDDALPGWTPGWLADRVADFATSWLLAQAVFEAYIIQNTASAAAREADVADDDLLSPRDAKRRAMAAERHLESEIIYLEYSGTFGDGEATAILRELSEAVSWSRVWYGGGVDSAESAQTVLDAGADAVVVGDVFHDVATFEREVCARAEDALATDASRTAIGEWVDREVDLAGTSPVRYLSTIPGVHNPRARARDYLVATVDAWLSLRDLAAAMDGPETAADLEAALASWTDGGFPGEADLRYAVGDDARALARETALAMLGEAYDVDAGDLPAAHLGLAARLADAA